MRILLILLLLLVLTTSLFAQEENRKPVSGTKFSMIPPKGFTVAPNFSGFINNETGSSIMLATIPAPVETLTAAFTADALKTKGMTFIDKEQVDFQNGRATLVRVSQPANGTVYLKQILIFGDAKNTVMVNAIYPESQKAAAASMKTAILSTNYESGQNDDPRDAVSFSVDPADTDFKLISGMSGSLTYSTEGKPTAKTPVYIAASSVGSGNTGDKKQFATSRFKQLPRGQQSVIRETNAITIAGLSGFEIIGTGKAADGGDELVYQLILFNEDGTYFIFIGKSAGNGDKHLPVFRKISGTFRKK